MSSIPIARKYPGMKTDIPQWDDHPLPESTTLRDAKSLVEDLPARVPQQRGEVNWSRFAPHDQTNVQKQNWTRMFAVITGNTAAVTDTVLKKWRKILSSLIPLLNFIVHPCYRNYFIICRTPGCILSTPREETERTLIYFTASQGLGKNGGALARRKSYLNKEKWKLITAWNRCRREGSLARQKRNDSCQDREILIITTVLIPGKIRHRVSPL